MAAWVLPFSTLSIAFRVAAAGRVFRLVDFDTTASTYLQLQIERKARAWSCKGMPETERLEAAHEKQHVPAPNAGVRLSAEEQAALRGLIVRYGEVAVRMMVGCSGETLARAGAGMTVRAGSALMIRVMLQKNGA